MPSYRDPVRLYACHYHTHNPHTASLRRSNRRLRKLLCSVIDRLRRAQQLLLRLGWEGAVDEYYYYEESVDLWNDEDDNDGYYYDQTYHDYHMDIVRESVRRTVPTINYPGATAFHNALDENLTAALTGTLSAEDAMADTERQWKRIARRVGEDKLVEAIMTNKAAWPDFIDPV